MKYENLEFDELMSLHLKLHQNQLNARKLLCTVRQNTVQWELNHLGSEVPKVYRDMYHTAAQDYDKTYAEYKDFMQWMESKFNNQGAKE